MEIIVPFVVIETMCFSLNVNFKNIAPYGHHYDVECVYAKELPSVDI